MQEREQARRDRERTRALFERFIERREQYSQHNAAPDSQYERLREELAVVHLNLVRFLAVRFANRGEPLDDLDRKSVV